MDNFDFVSDDKFRSILERDFAELQVCLNNNAVKSVLVLSGSIIEAILLEYFINNIPTNMNKNQVLKLTFANLINEAHTEGLISSISKDLSSVIRNYRNLIHPGKEVRTQETYDYETGAVSLHLVKIILKEIKENYFHFT